MVWGFDSSQDRSPFCPGVHLMKSDLVLFTSRKKATLKAFLSSSLRHFRGTFFFSFYVVRQSGSLDFPHAESKMIATKGGNNAEVDIGAPSGGVLCVNFSTETV